MATPTNNNKNQPSTINHQPTLSILKILQFCQKKSAATDTDPTKAASGRHPIGEVLADHIGHSKQNSPNLQN